MIKIDTYNQDGKKAGVIELKESVFGIEVKETLVHQAMVTQMANERQVLAHTKGRAEVRGGGRKPWKQKGTGRARAGSRRSPIWIGGGVTFGPTKDRNFSKDINKKMKRKAIFMVLSDKVKNDDMVVMEGLKFEEFKTKTVDKLLVELEKSLKKEEKQKRSFLIINDAKDEKTKYSARNLAGVKIINLDNINILDLLKYRNLIFTAEGVKAFEERYNKKETVENKKTSKAKEEK